MSSDNPLEPKTFTGEFGIDSISECEGLHMLVLSSCDHVRLQMCQPVSYLNMPPEQALALAESLTRAANKTLELQKEAVEVH